MERLAGIGAHPLQVTYFDVKLRPLRVSSPRLRRRIDRLRPDRFGKAGPSPRRPPGRVWDDTRELRLYGVLPARNRVRLPLLNRGLLGGKSSRAGSRRLLKVSLTNRPVEIVLGEIVGREVHVKENFR